MKIYINRTGNDGYDLKINVVEPAPGIDTTDIPKKREESLAENKLATIGHLLLKLVKTMDSTFAGMIANTFFDCILIATIALYNASSVIFRAPDVDLYLSSLACLFIFVLSISRLARLSRCGHDLMKEMKECVYHLERYKFDKKKMNMEEIELLRRDFRAQAESPINPFSAFSLSSKTFLGACGTIVTYIIVLLQFKVSEPPIESEIGLNISKDISWRSLIL